MAGIIQFKRPQWKWLLGKGTNSNATHSKGSALGFLLLFNMKGRGNISATDPQGPRGPDWGVGVGHT